MIRPRPAKCAPGAALRRACDDGERALGHVHALRGDRRALRLGQLGQAELADAAPVLELVHQLACERDPVAAGAARRVSGAAARLEAQDGCEVSRHGATLLPPAGNPFTAVEDL